MRVVLISTYELGRQPFGLASPAAWLRECGAHVRCLDLALEKLDEESVRSADVIAFHLPMHTATRIAARVLPRVRALAPRAHLACYGLYAPMNEALLRSLGVRTLLGGEFEAGLAALVAGLGAARADVEPQTAPLISLERLAFRVPDRAGLPPLGRYGQVTLPNGEQRVTGYTEASRGCKHLCRHCPIVPVYQGRFRVVPREVVLADVRQQVAAGATHITFGDPDFFNGVGHARSLVRALHDEHPALTYDVTIKVEHLLEHARDLATLRETGCLFVVCAVESLDDAVLERLDKGHTRADFLRALKLVEDAGLTLIPTFVAFTPWQTAPAYQELLAAIDDLDLVAHVAPVQLAMRLLIPAGSRLLELSEVRALVGPFDPRALAYPWQHEDTRVEQLFEEAQSVVAAAAKAQAPRTATFDALWEAAARAARAVKGRRVAPGRARTEIPSMNEPWYC